MIAFAFALYLTAVAAIAWFAWRSTRTLEDYLAGGRRVRAPAAALSAGASDMSGWLLLGLPGLAVAAPATAAWTAAGLLAGTWANWRFVARRVRETSERVGAITLPVLLERLLDDRSGVLRVLSALAIVVFFVFYTSAGLVAGGKLFNTVFGLPYAGAVVLGAALVALYTLLGGFLAVTWTDALQATMMVVALALVAGLLADSQPVVAAGVRTGTGSSGLAIASALAWGLGYPGQPHILARFIALESPGRARRARHIAVAWTAAALCAAVAVGAWGTGLLPAGADPERVFIIAVQTLLPTWLAGFTLAAILAAIMSTADSQLLVASSAIAEDLWPRARGEVDHPARLRRGRAAVLGVCALATVIALDPGAQVLGLVAWAWAGFGATFGPALVIALYVPGASASAAVAGMVTGAATVVCWHGLEGGWFDAYELLPGFAAATLVNLVCLAVQRAAAARQGKRG